MKIFKEHDEGERFKVDTRIFWGKEYLRKSSIISLLYTYKC